MKCHNTQHVYTHFTCIYLSLISQIIITCIHLCNLTIFFTHNKQYSLLLLIYVQVQYDLAITRFTCVNVFSLNCLNFFWNIKLVRLVVCVCVFGIYVLKIFFGWEMILRVQNVVWILGCVACLIAFISMFFPSWKTIFKQSRHLHDTSRRMAYLSSSSVDFYHNLDTSR